MGGDDCGEDVPCGGGVSGNDGDAIRQGDDGGDEVVRCMGWIADGGNDGESDGVDGGGDPGGEGVGVGGSSGGTGT